MDVVQLYVKPVKDFAKDSMRLVKRCTKPDLKGRFTQNVIFLNEHQNCKKILINVIQISSLQCAEFQKIAVATAIGFAIMGFIGFFVKLIHIPINNIIV